MGTDQGLQGHGPHRDELPFREDSFPSALSAFPLSGQARPVGLCTALPAGRGHLLQLLGCPGPREERLTVQQALLIVPPGEWAEGPFSVLPGHRDAFTLGLSSPWKPTIFQRASLLPVVPHLSPACCADLVRECEMSATGNRRNNSCGILCAGCGELQFGSEEPGPSCDGSLGM